MQFPDGSSDPPSDLRRTDYDCPFSPEEEHSYPTGEIIMFSVCFTVALITILMSFVIWRTWWNVPNKPLDSTHELVFGDVLIILSVVFEAF